jgi:HD superfamily phosphohydrolase
MLIQDEIWGEWDLTDPLIIELISSKPIQRLKKITNDGANRYLFEVGDPTRYKHSMGVLYLAQRFSKKRENHIMAILHDVAHTAFSHVVDFVFDKADTQDMHQDVKKQVLDDSEIKQILTNYGYTTGQFGEKDDYPMVGGGKKVVNADRIDYFMRDGFGLGALPLEQIKLYIDKLNFDEDSQEFYFTDVRVAGSFALACINTAILQYLGPNAIGSNYLLSQALKHALEIELIRKEDLMKTDDVVMSVLRSSRDATITTYLSRLSRSTKFEFCSREDSEYITRNKVRYVDPRIKLESGEVKRVSECVSNFRDLIKSLEEKYSEVAIRQI